jgi:molybdopterin-guanine dinucleotide biosynthesis protein A
MGRPKEGVVLSDGRRMIEHVIEPLRGVCRRVVIVGACRGYPIPAGTDLVHLNDSKPGGGPLAAIAMLLHSGLDPEGYLVVACDQPFLTSPLLRLLVEEQSPPPRFFRSEGGAPLDPFPGYLPIAWLPEVEGALQRGERSIRRLIQKTPASWVSLPDSARGCLKGINMPSDLP